MLKLKFVLYLGFGQASKHGLWGREQSWSSKDPVGQCIKDLTENYRHLVMAIVVFLFLHISYCLQMQHVADVRQTNQSEFFIIGPVGQTRILNFGVADQNLSVLLIPCLAIVLILCSCEDLLMQKVVDSTEDARCQII